LLGKNIWSEFASAIETPVYAAYQEAMAEGTATALEFSYPAFDAWYQVHIYPAPEGLSVFFRDVTESRRLSRELRASEEKYRTLVDHLPALVYVLAADDPQTPRYFSPYLTELTGYLPEEALRRNHHWLENVHPGDRARVAAEDACALATGAPLRVEYRYRCKDGNYVWVLDESIVIRDEQGAIVALQGVLLDISDRVQAEQALAASERRFRTAFEDAPIGMALTSPQFGVLQVNRALCAMLGYGPHELIGTTLRDLTHPDDIEANRGLVEQALAGEIDDFALEKRYFHKDGHVVWAQLHVSLVRDDDGTPLYFISQTQDITARRDAEDALRAALDAAQAASRAKSQFLAMMSHELRTPMQAVLGYAEVLLAGQGGRLTPEQREDLGYIHQGGNRMMTLIAKMLDLSRIEAGVLQIILGPVDLETILEEVRQDVALQAETKGLDFAFHVPPHLPAVLADPVRLHQILLNLIGNAVKFTERGSVRVTAVAAEEDVQITIRDTGIGIPADALPQIFEEFRQADSSLTRRHGGAGLGLAIAQKLAGLMGSRITVESAVGAGSIFTLHMPTSRRQRDESASGDCVGIAQCDDASGSPRSL
jgi:PAS domain S-box-containing protein